MINKDRLVELFTDIVKIDSLTKNERKMADELTRRLEKMGYHPYEDDTAEKIGGTSGNIICKIPGNVDVPGVMLMAHMDTVVPGLSKKPVISGDIITSDGTTILGADDLAGVACIFEAVECLRENSISHGDVYVVFTVAEEGGLFGAQNLDLSNINAKYAFILDDEGPIGTAAIKAPYYNKLIVTFKGKAAHAGLEPEKGNNAIKIAADAVMNMPHFGRIDDESTCNLGIINGGKARNIVCDSVTIQGEVRSIYLERLNKYTDEIVNTYESIAKKHGAEIEILVEKVYDLHNVDVSDEIIKHLEASARDVNIDLHLHSTGGGSDTNIINAKGLKAINLSVGMENVHSTKESRKISNMVKATEFVVSIIKKMAR